MPLLLMEAVGNLVTQMQQPVHAMRVNHYPLSCVTKLEISYVPISKTSITLRYSINHWHEPELKPAAKLQKESI